MTRFTVSLLMLLLCVISVSIAQSQEQSEDRYVSDVWVADNGDGTYTNPIIHADYSDPDVVRVGNDYYMTASSFSTDGENFIGIGESFQARPGGWIGAKVGLFASRPHENYDSGFTDFDWFRITEND